MEKINGIIHEGRVYVADPNYAQCDKCDLSLMCKDVEEHCDYSLCITQGVNNNNDFGYRYSPELTDKLKGE